MRAHEEVALAFAEALVAGDFAGARGRLAPALGAELGESGLEECLTRMCRGVAAGPRMRCRFVPEGSLDTWPGQESGDLGWVYVGIEGEDFVEAVYVLVREVDGAAVIAEIRWGRP